MLNKTSSQKQLASWTGKALIAASVLLLALTLFSASRFTGNQNAMNVMVNLGPLKLIELGRISTPNGLAGTITYLPGLIFYFTGAVVIGVGIALPQAKNSRHANK